MTILYIALPVALLLAAASVGAFIWSVRSGQFDGLETPPLRILFDEEKGEKDLSCPRESGSNET